MAVSAAPRRIEVIVTTPSATLRKSWLWIPLEGVKGCGGWVPLLLLLLPPPPPPVPYM